MCSNSLQLQKDVAYKTNIELRNIDCEPLILLWSFAESFFDHKFTETKTMFYRCVGG